MSGDADEEKDAADDTVKHADCEISLDADTVGEGSEDEEAHAADPEGVCEVAADWEAAMPVADTETVEL
jgi:hypothetical protein